MFTFDTNLLNEFNVKRNQIRKMILDTYPHAEIDYNDYLTLDFPDYIINPDSNNEEWKTKTSLSIWLVPLSYYYKPEKKDVMALWFKCTFDIGYLKGIEDPNGCNRINMIVKHFRDTIVKKLPIKAFYDEDANWGYFSERVRENLSSVEYSFYINPDIPEGYWENHTL